MANNEWVKTVYLNPGCVICGESCSDSDLIFDIFGFEVMNLVAVFKLYRFLSDDVFCEEILEQIPQFCNVCIVLHGDGAP